MAGDTGGRSGAGGSAAPAGGAAASGGRGAGLELEQFPQEVLHDESSTHGFRDYYRVLAHNRHFRLLWAAEMVDSVGSWLSYVATLEMASELSQGSGLAISAVVLIRFLPSLALAPVCGVVADRVNRVRVLVAAATADAAVMAVLALVPLAHRTSQVALLYLMLTLQFAAASFYDPARKALVPVLVPAEQLHLAATVDSWAWSITGAFGASVGGLVASRLGLSACFIVDAVTYLVAAWCALQLPVALGRPDAATRSAKKSSSSREIDLATFPDAATAEGRQAGHGKRSGRASIELLGSEDSLEIGAALGPAVTHAERRHHHQQHHDHHDTYHSKQGHQQETLQLLAREPARLAGQGPEPVPAELPILWQNACSPSRPDALPAPAAGGAASTHQGGRTINGTANSTAMLTAAKAAVAEGMQATAEGWAYVSSSANRDVAALVLMKCAAALVWGAVDILNVRFSEMPSMQLGDASTTLGLIFSAVGLGCFVGPMALNSLIPPHTPALRWGVAVSYILFFAGLLVMLVAPTIWLVLLSTVVRSMGSAALWVYSTLLMQKRVPNDYLGRMSALEGAGYTVAETASSLFGGMAFDVFHLSLYQLLLILTAAAGLEAVVWCAYARLANQADQRKAAGGGGAGRGGYLPVRQQDVQEDDEG